MLNTDPPFVVIETSYDQTVPHRYRLDHTEEDAANMLDPNLLKSIVKQRGGSLGSKLPNEISNKTSFLSNETTT